MLTLVSTSAVQSLPIDPTPSTSKTEPETVTYPIADPDKMEEMIIIEKYFQTVTNKNGKRSLITVRVPMPVLVPPIPEGGQVKVLNELGGFADTAYRKRTIMLNGSLTAVGILDKTLENKGYPFVLHVRKPVPSRNTLLGNPNWSKHSFSLIDPQGRSVSYELPVGFPVCKEIRWGVDMQYLQFSGTTVEEETRLWNQVFQEVAFFSGYTFRNVPIPDGSSVPTGNSTIPAVQDNLADIIIGYGTSEPANPGYRKNMEKNYAVASWEKLSGWNNDNQRLTFDASTIVFNYDALLRDKTSNSARLNIMRHELGHALGLGHLEETGNTALSVMMKNSNYGNFTGWGYGDVKGLRTLAALPCE